MRLEKIKLAGFKSFVDPTTADFPTNLVGVVGPNGCGKSNIIDAVRWVMGESSAKMLRGESMADVIFNGSSSRKPVGTASIELIFDNSDGGAGGQYASYSQISVKRQVSRDGQSNYYLNNTRCRRRDITDLFLGTGLGPRSYSIIEQGMISRVIEARPEELRVYLEEAAGISKYKERRRETENRIRHTRENLERLDDLIEEVGKQLKHLERQAATAEKYKTFKAEERQLRGECLALRWKSMHDELGIHEREIAAQENKLEAEISTQRQIESEIEQMRSDHTDANDNFNQVQGEFYALGAEIARLEQTIQYALESRARQQADLSQLESSLQELNRERQQDKERLASIAATLLAQQPLLDTAETEERTASEQMAASETAMQHWQSEWDSFNQQANEPAQLAQVERTKINHIESEAQKLQQRLQRNSEERERLQAPDLVNEIDTLENRQREAQARLEEKQSALDSAIGRIGNMRQQQESVNSKLNDARAELQSSKGRLASLEALQQAAATEGSEGANWLKQQDLAEGKRLAQSIDVSSDWRKAVETVLAQHLQAICVDDFSRYSSAVVDLEEGLVELIESAGGTQQVADDSLLKKVNSKLDLSGLLGSVRMADSLHDALSRRNQLNGSESFITADGIQIGKNWMRFGREAGAQKGILEREQQIRELQQTQSELEKRVESLANELEQHGEEITSAEAQREQQQQEYNQVNRELADIRSQLSAKKARADHLRQRLETVEQEHQELNAMIAEGHETIETSKERLYEALEVIETMSSKRDALVQQRDRIREELEQARQQVTVKRAEVHKLSVELSTMRSQHSSLEESSQRSSNQIEQMSGRREALAESLSGDDSPIEEQKQKLEEQLQSRLKVEEQLGEARKLLETLEAGLRQKEQDRHKAEESVQNQREKLEKARMSRQETMVRTSTLEDQLREGKYDQKALLDGLDEETDLQEWQQKHELVSNRIQRLGPINLAAIDEFKEQSERMEYLDTQRADVNKSLDTLEEAIRKIDRETRTRFKETFEKVNTGIKELFPKLFGGGHAYLEMTGEDLLDTGVTVMARPPGKRNSSIHLLSGGEKALTAVALVFSIFRLNPAPFCMLDEVDAPLDDANVGRFCQMVKEMSDQVQFIFITHNKITMELSNQLQGVTMHEPGVSRLVSVDIEEAAQMAAM
ncbi:chromosome segregation protein SMC [Solemya velum gill symbiont]|uniref:chromosome segregation protein SMC n=1 Tax=Solemya velum gill symbiont TaxID=2340 RepID=UPI0009985B13|nr:chromosome segregation protein SMC [Solemya velum gill symbiont]OOY60699.1 chromosome segregation protein SMC [Solemya velum gill symbiont]OOY71958.1 chromosome segregation protein SMC [Solemya velum gill symbiont]